MLPKKRKHCLQVFEVVFNGLGEDEDIIKIDYHEGIQVGVHHVVHSSLESSWGICEPKWHCQPFILTIHCNES